MVFTASRRSVYDRSERFCNLDLLTHDLENLVSLSLKYIKYFV